MKLAVNNPNLSAIMPVGCNAKCNFCYWEKSEANKEHDEIVKKVFIKLEEVENVR